ncbi:MAG: galactose mutarotase [Bacteroidales bacterium]|nr:galactose mutarotase [Bacteroidales bacterium]
MTINKEVFGKIDNQQIFLFTLKNKNGMTVKITNYGGIVTSLLVPDKNGKLDDVVLGFDNLDDYLQGHPYFGAIVGRYGNRIAKGKFTLNGKEYNLAINNGPNHLHGGIKGFDKAIWSAAKIKENDYVGLRLSHFSKDGDEGYPGNLGVIVIYSLTNNNELKIKYQATTDKATPVNLTHHSYFNLAGTGDIFNHELMIDANKYTVVNNNLIPTGELRNVKETAFDFTSSKKIGKEISDVEGGYDHNFVLNNYSGETRKVVEVLEPISGRIMEVFTSEPGIQFYSGNFLDGTEIGKNNKVYNKHYGFCLETQHFPDSPNQLEFPSTILHPGETYTHKTIYKFSVK